MKHLIILFAALSLSLTLCAQTETDTTSSPQGEPKLKVDLGIEAGFSLFTGQTTPYDASRGFVLRLPLMAHFNLSQRWQLNTGLRYDFEWSTLRYNVEYDFINNDGLHFLSTPTTAHQKTRTYHGYIGIPVQLVWYPWPANHRALGIGLDIYAAYAVSRYIIINNRDARYTYSGVHTANATTVIGSDAPMFQPWKLEMGLTFSTDVIGLLHGVRLFANLLPTYIDPVTNEKIYTSGITLFL